MKTNINNTNYATKCIFSVEMFAFVFVMVLSTSSVMAKTFCSNDGVEIPVAVPAFSCSDGVVVPKAITGKNAAGHDTCEPEDLYGRCIFNSTLGRLEKKEGKKKGVDIIFSCRKDRTSNHKGDTGDKYFDIAVIQYDRNSGNTCFYQYLSGKDSRGENLPKPGSKKGKNFWTTQPFFCTGCHSNGPFVRSPHYVDIKDKDGDKILPSLYNRAGRSDASKIKYKVLHDHYKVYDVRKSGNACLDCHNIGAFTKTGSTKLRLGYVNLLSSGTVRSLVEARHGGTSPSPTLKATTASGNDYPTADGYHDFMIGMMGITSKGAKAAVKDLEACLKKPTPKGCTITKISP